LRRHYQWRRTLGLGFSPSPELGSSLTTSGVASLKLEKLAKTYAKKLAKTYAKKHAKTEV
jgi:hypothetical protein